MVKKQILILMSLLLCVATYSQQIKIAGKVFNQQGQLLEHVGVSQANTANGVFTNNRGQYQLTVAPSDTIKLLFNLIGYQKTQYIISKPTENLELSIVLQQSDKELNTVIIEGDKKQTNTFYQLNTSGLNLLSSASGASVETLIATFAGVSSTNELSSQYSVRGGNFDENMVYVNGIEIHRPLLVRTGQQEGLSFINPDMVENVGFSSGGYNSEYGDKMSSVLEIKYKTPKPFEAKIGASLLGGSVYVGNTSGRFSQITGIRYKTNESLLKSTDTKAEYDPSYTDAQTYITYKLSSNWDASFLGNYSHNEYKFTPQTRETAYGTLNNVRKFNVYFNGWEKDKFINYHAALSINGKVSDRLNIGFTGATFSSDEQERYDIAGQYWLTEEVEQGGNGGLLGVGSYLEHARNKLDVDIYSFSHTGTFNLNQHQIKWGLTYQKEEISDRIKEWEMRDSTGYSIPHSDDFVSVYSNLKSNNKINTSRYSGFVQDNFVFETTQGLFILNAGVRAGYWDFNEEFTISPRGSIAFIPSAANNLTIRFATGVYYQAPFYKELQLVKTQGGNNNIVELNKDIKSQKSIHFVLGSDYYFKAGTLPFKLTSELYYKKLSDVNPYTVNNVKIRYAGENIAKGYVMGLDMKLYGEFIPGTDSWISFSLMKTEQNIGGIKLPLPTDQRYNLSACFQDYMPGYERFRMSIIGFLSQGLPTTPPHQGFKNKYFRSTAYKRVDIGLSWQALGENFAIRNKNSFFGAFKNIWLGLDVFNIFDMENISTYYWIADVHNTQHAVPNYLTGRQLNIKLIAEF